MRILFFSMWYYPEPVGKPHSLAKELVQQGNSVTVITTFPNYPKGQIYTSYKSKIPVYVEHIDGVRVIRIASFHDRSLNLFKRIVSLLSYSCNAFWVSLVLAQKFDIVWSYQVGYPSLAYSALIGLPHVHEIQDLWPAWGENKLKGFNKRISSLLLGIQRVVYYESEQLVTISNGFKNAIVSGYGVPSEKITVLPNWADTNFFDYHQHISVRRNDFGLPEGFILTYGGNVGTAQGLKSLVDAAKLIGDKRNISIVIAGDGVERDSLISYARQEKVGNVIFMPSLPPDKMGALLAISDCLYISLEDEAKYEITIPSKIYSYLAAGRPILASTKGDVASLIIENDIGFVVQTKNPREIASAIINISMLEKVKLEELGLRAYLLSKTKYDGKIVGKQYASIFENLLRRNVQ